nr:MAG TPA: hypothetical protein [Caudoviricetes sp.]
MQPTREIAPPTSMSVSAAAVNIFLFMIDHLNLPFCVIATFM